MRIVQSFARYEEGNSYLARMNDDEARKEEYFYLNFYTFLLSYLTIKKYAGPVTMCCNEEAYNKLLRFIPYDEVIPLENSRPFEYWSLYKIDAMRTFDEDVIHVDPDVMIFKRLFDLFSSKTIIDMLVQHNLSEEKNFTLDFVTDNEDFLVKNGLIDLDRYDNCSQCTSVFGLRKKHAEEYYKGVDLLFEAFRAGEFGTKWTYHRPVIIEEYSSYMMSNRKGFNVQEILPRELVRIFKESLTGNEVGYTHLWCGSRFEEDVVELVKNKIKREFPEHYHLVEKFDIDIFEKIVA